MISIDAGAAAAALDNFLMDGRVRRVFHQLAASSAACGNSVSPTPLASISRQAASHFSTHPSVSELVPRPRVEHSYPPA